MAHKALPVICAKQKYNFCELVSKSDIFDSLDLLITEEWIMLVVLGKILNFPDFFQF